MIDYIEVKPLPSCCNNCKELDCYNCDNLCRRWIPTEESKRQLDLLWEEYRNRQIKER